MLTPVARQAFFIRLYLLLPTRCQANGPDNCADVAEKNKAGAPMKITILDGEVLNPGDVDWDPIEALGHLRIYAETPPHLLAEHVQDAEVVLTNKTPLRREDMPKLPNVRMVGVLATGYDVVDTEAFAQRNVPVCNVVAYGVNDVAQHAMALLLELCNHTSLHTASVKNGEWAERQTWCYWKSAPVCLNGLTMGIIGFGAIGRRLGELAHAFGMEVLAVSRTRKNAPDYSPFAFVSLAEMLARAQVISLHCPLTSQTRQIINAATLAAMRPGTWLINTARGALVDETAAAQALRTGQLAGLGADVLAQEPPSPDNPLLHAPNTLITPHIAWASRQARQNIIDLTAQNIRCWQQGHPINVVNAPSHVH